MDAIPQWLFFLAAAVAGLELGGLATIFIQRWIDEKPILRPGGSQCPSCETRLSLLETIPVVSYFLLRGRCRHCDQRIGPQYMLVEISCLAWSLAIAHHFGPGLEWCVFLVLGILLITGSFIDFETYLLPHRVTLGGAAIAMAASFILPEPGWKQAAMGAAAGGGFFFVIQHAYRLLRGEEGLGSGDVKLMLMIGAMVGLKGLPVALLLASMASAVGVFWFAFRAGENESKLRIPFGPFLSLGAMLYVLYGDTILNWMKG